jgi:hypothetical protein
MSVNLAQSMIKAGAEAQIAAAGEYPDMTGRVLYGPIRCTSTDSADLPCTPVERKMGAVFARETYVHCRVQIGLCCGSTPRGYLVKVLRKDATAALVPRIWDACTDQRPAYKSWVNVVRDIFGKNKRCLNPGADYITTNKKGWA